MRLALHRHIFLVFTALLATQASALTSSLGSLPDFTQLVEQVAPAVVNISTTQKVGESSRAPHNGLPDQSPEEFRKRFKDTPIEEFFERFFDQQFPPGGDYESESLGSGFIVSADGYVLTNEHVVRDADEIIVKLHDRRQLSAELIGVDKRSDVAVLKITAKADNLPFVKLANNRGPMNNPLKVGEWVVAIGSPFGFDHTVTAGIVSAIGRNLRSEQYVPFIQTDVAINPGNSGGPLFNMNGEVVGINSQIFSRTGGYMGMSFAIPIELAMQVTDQLREGGVVRRGWLGVMIQEVDRDLAKAFGLDRPQGALIAQIMDDSPAERSELQVEDIILRFNGRTVRDSGALPPLVGSVLPGNKVPVVVWRDGKKVTLEVKIEELDDDTVAGGKNSAETPLGLTVEEVDEDKRKELGIKESGGVLVVEAGDGAARNAGIRAGDIILRLNGTTVQDDKDLAKRVKAAAAGSVLRMLVFREGTQQFIAVPLPDDK